MQRGEKMSEEQKRKISKTLVGHVVLLGTRKKISEKCKGKHPVTEFKTGNIKFSNAYKFPTGQNNPSWKGGLKKSKGYWYVLISYYHPNADKKGYVKRSRLVMEKKISRFLSKKEVIHHINRNLEDDRIENLQLFNNQSDHIKFHKNLCLKI